MFANPIKPLTLTVFVSLTALFSLFFACALLLSAPATHATAITKGEQTLEQEAQPATHLHNELNQAIQEKSAKTIEQATKPGSIIDAPWVTYTVQRTDNLTSLFKRAGLTAKDVYYVSNAVNLGNELSRLYPGEEISFQIKSGALEKVKYKVSPLKTLLIERMITADGYLAKLYERTPVTRQRYIGGEITNSLFADAEKAGLSNNMIMRFSSIFGWDVDFSQDIRPGDQFRIIYNEQLLDGEKIRDGHIVAAEFINQGHKYTAIRYTDSEGNSSYFSPDGASMRKAFLRMPVEFARVSSGFSLSRKHPALNRIRAHKGVDYAATTGTPIKASGDGKILWKGTKRGYGRTIILQHGSEITTLYAHMSRYNDKLKKGSLVKQGQVIGYVGRSGLATGPHLHYEFRVNGQHKNPMTVKIPDSSPIPKKEQEAFAALAEQMQTQLETYAGTQLAFNTP